MEERVGLLPAGSMRGRDEERERERERYVRWEQGLPSAEELTPLNQSLITPILACAFSIKEGGLRNERTEAEVEKAAQATLNGMYDTARLGGKTDFLNSNHYQAYGAMSTGDSRAYFSGASGSAYNMGPAGNQPSHYSQPYDSRNLPSAQFSHLPPPSGYQYGHGFPDSRDSRMMGDGRFSSDPRYGVDPRYPPDPRYVDPRMPPDPRYSTDRHMSMESAPPSFSLPQGERGLYGDTMRSDLRIGAEPIPMSEMRSSTVDLRGVDPRSSADPRNSADQRNAVDPRSPVDPRNVVDSRNAGPDPRNGGDSRNTVDSRNPGDPRSPVDSRNVVDSRGVDPRGGAREGAVGGGEIRSPGETRAGESRQSGGGERFNSGVSGPNRDVASRTNFPVPDRRPAVEAEGTESNTKASGSLGSGNPKKSRKTQEEAEDDEEVAAGGPENSSDEQLPRTLKRPRLVWTPQLHKRFVDAVGHLGIKNAVPKTIMQLMNVEGLTRENVASHLQKYRLYLKRMQGLSNDAPSAADQLFASTPLPQSLTSPPHSMYMPSHREDLAPPPHPQNSYGGPGPAMPHMSSLTHDALTPPMLPYVPYDHHQYGSMGRQQLPPPRSPVRDSREYMMEPHGPAPNSPPQRILSLFPSSGK